MIFSSAEFLFCFLPATVVLFFGLGHFGQRQLAKVCLVAASLIFYAWSNVGFLPLLLFSIGMNYTIGHYLHQFSDDDRLKLYRKALLWLGLILNLGLLGYFKYTNFLISTANSLLSSNLALQQLVLPVAISFFTFTQIAYLVDTYQLKAKPSSFLNYCLLITFFPYLVAGPIIRQHEILPQFESPTIYRLNLKNIALGLTFLGLGLFKKVVIADYIASYANAVFYQASTSTGLSLIDAWIGTISYTLQLYFDFSGYSDMAIGAAQLFGIQVPLNFNSPYKSTSIVEFWRRWHITLSNFLRDYLYIPLGGSRQGNIRRNLNLLATMLLGGLWHGAGWPFVIWGGMHGLYLMLNHQWNAWQKQRGLRLADRYAWTSYLAGGMTFIAVMIAWVFFRAESLNMATQVLLGMVGRYGIASTNWSGLQLLLTIGIVATLLGITWMAPNTQELLQGNFWETRADNNIAIQSEPSQLEPAESQRSMQWVPNTVFGIILGILFFLASKIFLSSSSNEFLYFSF